tara:strand:- start:1642 stop:3768 length:2127 start_codon:yes stop_codon:yes gene_type:complete
MKGADSEGRWGRIVAFGGLLCLNSLGFLAVASDDVFSSVLQPTFKEKCIQCHGQDGKVKGKVNLLEIESQEDLFADPDLLADILDMIEYEEMPPEDEPQLSEDKRHEMVASLDHLLTEYVADKMVYVQAPIRRMNRFHYNNAVVDLFDLKATVFTLPERMMREHKDYFKPETGVMAETVHVGSRPLGKSQMIEPRLVGVAAFPQDLRAEHGYDNRGDHLSLSPLLMESFLKLSQSITQSRDFVPKYVGIWNSFFENPPEGVDPKAEAKTRLEPFLTKAFRRPVESDVLDRYVGFAHHQLDGGVEFTEVMKGLAAATIASPKFLYLYDDSAEGDASEAIGDIELASRLSFFLWGSIPDEELLEVAIAGDLNQSDVLDSQIDRMFRDHKIKRFCDSFPAQWLQLDRIISSVPDREKFPDFYFSQYRDSMHMMLEPLLLFEAVLIEDQPITQLIDSDFTYRSRLLQTAYGYEWPEDKIQLNAKGNPVGGEGASTVLRFDRMPVEDRRYGGVITNAAVMTMTSGPERTQPITRGAWLATVIFNDPPEPPPADVPALGEKPEEGEEHLTLRERLSMHRERADCRGCHEQIDPLGFALENYDAVGIWRDKYENDREVDMEGVLFRKHEFTDVIEFKDAILAEKDRFTQGFAGHLLSFALARELGVADELALDEVAEATANDGYRIQTLIKGIIQSEPFQSKTNPGTSTSIAETD